MAYSVKKRRIEMDYRKALQQADKLDNIADDIDRLKNDKLNANIQDLSAAWKGESAGAYLSKEQALGNNLGDTARRVRTAAADIRSKARRIYSAEMRALEIAQRRTYGGGGSSGGGGSNRSW